MPCADVCAIVSIFAEEDSSPGHERALASADAPFTPTLAAWEAITILSRPDQLDCAYLDAHAVVTEWLDLRNTGCGIGRPLKTHCGSQSG